VSSSQSWPQRVICRLPRTTLVLSIHREHTPVRPGAARAAVHQSVGVGDGLPVYHQAAQNARGGEARKRWRTSPEWAASS
jgi:hypothetical protein